MKPIKHRIRIALTGKPRTTRQMLNEIISEMTENKREPLYKKPWFAEGITTV